MGIETKENENKTKTTKKRKKMETSKKIILASYIITIILTTIVVVGTFLGYEMSNITTIAALAFAETSVSNAFYYNKAAKENVPKVLASLPELFREQVDVNQLLNQ